MGLLQQLGPGGPQFILKSSGLRTCSLCVHKQPYSWFIPVQLSSVWGKEASVIVYPKGSTMVLSQECSVSCLSAISEDHLSLGLSLSIALLTSKSDKFQRSDQGFQKGLNRKHKHLSPQPKTQKHVQNNNVIAMNTSLKINEKCKIEEE